jgi:uncharacterized SAM-binding protein YcdF (DUF218 family)
MWLAGFGLPMMLKLQSCPPSHASDWANFTWSLYGLMTKDIPLPLRIGAIALVGLGLGWLIWKLRRVGWQQFSQIYWQRWRTKTVVTFVVVCLLVSSPPGIALAIHLLISQVPADSGTKADMIVVLGRGWRLYHTRVDTAAALWQEQRAPNIFISGAGDALYLPPLLKKAGVPETVIGGENCSVTTEENAQITADFLQPQGVKKILLVTDPVHMLRSLLTFQSVGFDVIPHATAFPSEMGYREKVGLVLREYIALFSYAFKGRFSDR